MDETTGTTIGDNSNLNFNSDAEEIKSRSRTPSITSKQKLTAGELELALPQHQQQHVIIRDLLFKV